MLPRWGSTNLKILLPVVDFPQPLSPTKPKVSPCWREKFIPSTAWTCPLVAPIPDLIKNLVVKFLTSNNGTSEIFTLSLISINSLFLELVTLSPVSYTHLRAHET